MQVRVFKWTGQAGEEYLGSDFEFETMPEADQFLRLSDSDEDATIERVGFIQDGDRFVAAVWLNAPTSSYSEEQAAIDSAKIRAATKRHRVV